MFKLIRAMAGIALLELGKITQMQFDAMPRGRAPGRRMSDRSRYRPHQGNQEVARRLRQMEARNVRG